MKGKFKLLSLGIVYFIFFALWAGLAWGMDVCLIWDAATDPGVTGAKVYYKVGGTGEPYAGAEALEGSSPIDVGNVTEFTLTGLSNYQHRFVATFYDAQGMESDLSNEVKTKPDKPGLSIKEIIK